MTSRLTGESDKNAGEVGARILVIDDEEVIHASLKRTLERRGHLVDSELSAKDGLDRARRGDYDLIITDLMMPGINGIELLKQVQSGGPAVPVLMITGYPTIKTALQALRLGAVDYLAKPFTRRELIGPVNRALRRSGSGRDEGSADGDSISAPALTLAPGDRLVLRQHSWAVYQQDGTMEVGIEGSFLAGIGEIAVVELPREGELVEQGHIGFHLTTSNNEAHGVVMPISGEVVAVNADALTSPWTVDPDTPLARVLPDHLDAEVGLLERS